MDNGYKKTNMQRITSALIILFIVVFGFAVFKYLIHHKKRVSRKKPQSITIFVETKKVKRVDTNYKIPSYGRVVALNKVVILPQVSGKVVYVNPNFIEGGFLKKGDVILRIDKSDYELAYKSALSRLTASREELKLQLGKQRAAEAELLYAEKLVGKINKSSKYLILRKPNIKKALANLELAKADVKKAQLNLNRTTIRSPFDAYIINKYADIGSVVNPSVKIAQLINSNEFYIETFINTQYLNDIDIDNSTIAKIDFGDNTAAVGRFVSLDKSVDANGIMSKILFSVKNSNGIKNSLLVGNYASVEIRGKRLDNIIQIPINSLLGQNRVWLYNNGRLKIKKIKVIFKDKNSAYTYDLGDKDEVIVSSISLPIEGIKLKKIGNNEPK